MEPAAQMRHSSGLTHDLINDPGGGYKVVMDMGVRSMD
jgi:hypothetical protein